MKIRKTIKQIVAVGTGLTMLGATVFGAAAANLGAYPSQFIRDGQFDGLMVVGANAATEDVLGIVDIATSLQFSARGGVAEGTAPVQTILDGDVYEFGSSGTSDVVLGQFLGEVDSLLDHEDLGLLRTDRLRTARGTTDANQFLRFENEEGLKVVYRRDGQDRVVSDYLYVRNGQNLFTYELEFPQGFESRTFKQTVGSARVTSTEANRAYLQDITRTSVHMLGQEFNIVEAVIHNSTDTPVELTLMGGAAYDTLMEGETRTYEVDGQTYEVTVVVVADSAVAQSRSDVPVVLMINGEMTRQLYEGDTDTLVDGTVIGIQDVLPNEAGDSQDMVSFYIGASKVELRANGQVVIDEETLSDGTVEIDATWTGDTARISSITYTAEARSRYSGTGIFVPAGENVRAHLDEPESMFSEVWDIHYAGMTNPASTPVELNPTGRGDGYELSFENQQGISYRIPLVSNEQDASGQNIWHVGEEWDNGEGRKLVYETADADYSDHRVLKLDDSVIVSRFGDDDARTRVLRFSSVDTTDGRITFRDVGDNSEYQLTIADFGSYTNYTDSGFQATSQPLRVGGTSYKVEVATEDKGNRDSYRVRVATGGEFSSTGPTTITLNGGGILHLPPTNESWYNGTNVTNAASVSFDMRLEILDKYTELSGAESLNFSVSSRVTDDRDDNVRIGTVAIPRGQSFDSDAGSRLRKGMSTYGIYVEQSDDDADSRRPATLELHVPMEQRRAQVFVVGGETTSTAVGPSGDGPVQRIEVGRSVLDTEITNVAADNLIVVGGPCANTVAATLLGVSPNAPGCFEDFPVSQGEGIIKMVESGDKVAVIVAGYSAADTRAAAEVLANYEDYADDLEGMDEVVVSGQTIMAPTVAPEPTPEADADEDDSEEDEEGDDDHEESDDENNDEE